MADTRREAAHLRVALQFGLVTVADVVSWSDSKVQESDWPAPAFLELSSMWKAHPLDVLHVLRSMSEDVPAIQVLPAVLGLAHDRLLTEPAYGRRLAWALYLLYVECGCVVPEELSDIGWFDDAFDLAADGSCGSVEGVQELLLQFTGRFAAGIPDTQPPSRLPDAEVLFELTALRGTGEEKIVASGYSPIYDIRPDDWTSTQHEFIEVTEVRTGQKARAHVWFLNPECYPGTLWPGRVLNVAEGSRIVGRASVLAVLNPILLT